MGWFEDRYDMTRLMRAAKFNQHFLIERFAGEDDDLEERSPNGYTALQIAAALGHFEAVLELIQAGARLGYSPAGDREPIIFAARKGHVNVVDLLCQRNPSLTRVTNAAQQTALHIFAKRSKSDLPILNTLLAHNFDINAIDETQSTAIHLLVRRPNTESLVRRLLEAGANPALRDATGDTPEVIALMNDDFEVAAVLKDHALGTTSFPGLDPT